MTKKLNTNIKTNFEIFKINHQISRRFAKYAFIFILLLFSFMSIYGICYLKNINEPNNLLYFLLSLYIGNMYYLFYYFTPLIKQYPSSSWKRTNARIIQIEKLSIETRLQYSHYTEEFPYLNYSYTVNNKLYTNNRLSFHLEYSYNQPLTSNINILFKQWLEENEVKIYYNQFNPEESVILRRFTKKQYCFYYLITTFHFLSVIGLTCIFIKLI